MKESTGCLVLTTWLAFAAVAQVAAAETPEPKCTKDALKAAFAELWPQRDTVPFAPSTTYQLPGYSVIPFSDCGCWSGEDGTQGACFESAAYYECKRKEAAERESKEKVEREKAEARKARLDALAKACELPAFAERDQAEQELTFRPGQVLEWNDGHSAAVLWIDGKPCTLERVDGGLRCKEAIISNGGGPP